MLEFTFYRKNAMNSIEPNCNDYFKSSFYIRNDVHRF